MDSGHARGQRPFSDEREPVDWIVLWSFARFSLRLSEAEFWELTPAQLMALAERHKETQELEDARIGRLCAVMANVFRDAKKRPRAFQPSDFMPQKRTTLTSEQWRQRLVSLNAAYGGEVVEHG